MAGSMFQRVGGNKAVTALIDNFYAKVLASPLTNPVFIGKDIAKVKKYQVEFFSTALGSGTPYTGRSIVAAHTGLGITESQFCVVAVMLHQTMREMSIPVDIHMAVMDLASSLKPSIVGL
jgi:hemoglobin